MEKPWPKWMSSLLPMLLRKGGARMMRHHILASSPASVSSSALLSSLLVLLFSISPSSSASYSYSYSYSYYAPPRVSRREDVRARRQVPRFHIGVSNDYTQDHGIIGSGEYEWGLGRRGGNIITDLGIETRLRIHDKNSARSGNGTADASYAAKHGCSALWSWDVRFLKGPPPPPPLPSPGADNGSAEREKKRAEPPPPRLVFDNDDHSSATTTFSQPGTYSMRAQRSCAVAAEKPASIVVHAMPVRREFRSLLPAHRERCVRACVRFVRSFRLFILSAGIPRK